MEGMGVKFSGRLQVVRTADKKAKDNTDQLAVYGSADGNTYYMKFSDRVLERVGEVAVDDIIDVQGRIGMFGRDLFLAVEDCTVIGTLKFTPRVAAGGASSAATVGASSTATAQRRTAASA